MKVYQTSDIRNISLLGNAGSGKTTLAESMLLAGGTITRRGDISSKNTVSDYREIEHIQEGSVYSTLLYTEFNGKKVNILDTPGSDDFVGGVISSLHVTDTALIVLNTQNGIEVGAEIGFRNSKKMNKPVIFVANHLDHDNVNFDKTVEDAKDYFSNKVTIVQYPVNAGPDFDAVIDVIKMKMLKWSKDGGKAEELDIPAEEQDKAEELQNTLIEAAAENDEALMEVFFDKGTLTEDEMREGILMGIANRELFPVFCTSAKQNYGVHRLLEFVCNVVPSPDKVASVVTNEGTEIACDANGKTSFFIFKSSNEQHIGEVLYFKMISGKLTEGQDVINHNKSGKERIAQIFVVSGKSREKVPEIVAGDIGATVKLKETKIEHSLGDKDADWIYEPIKFPNPKFRTAVKAVNEADEEKLGEALNRLHQEDPTILVEYSKELRQIILSGQGEHHLNTIKWFLDNIYKIETNYIPPRIPYRETITKAAQSMYRHKKQSGGAGQFGEVHMVIEPYDDSKGESTGQTAIKTTSGTVTVTVRGREEDVMPWGGKLVFYNCIVGGVIDTRFLPAIKKGIMEKMERGPLTGSYARDIQVYIYDGKMHPVDSNEISFKLAGLNAFKDAFKIAGPKIMEPVYDVEVIVPSDKMGDIMSDLQGRRAVIMGMNNEGKYDRLKAKVPLAEMNRYSTTLSSLSSGRATYDMKFAEYAQVPLDVQDKLLKAYEAEQESEN